MICTDLHVHSSFSTDSNTPVKEMIEKAIELRFDRFYLTDHMDYDFPSDIDSAFLFLPELYFDTLNQYKIIYQDKIQIFIGIELGLQPMDHTIASIRTLLNQFSFDLIIGSTHLVDGLDPYQKNFWENRTEDEAIFCYYEEILKNLERFTDFQVLGHLDYVIRYLPSGRKTIAITPFLNIVDQILKKIISHGIALEINTGGYKYGLGQPNPGKEIIERYLTLGGDLISIGSDAHVPNRYGSDFLAVHTLLRNFGIKEYVTFEKGCVVKNPL